MNAADVTAVIVTRGDVDLDPVLDSLIFPHVVVWDNLARMGEGVGAGAFGRYVALAEAQPVAYAQDDDCLVDPVDQQRLVDAYEPGILTVLMPPGRVDYTDTVLIGWGSIFDRTLPLDAFDRWKVAGYAVDSTEFAVVGADFVFPMLTPWKRLDAEHVDLPHAHGPNRTWGSWPDYAAVKARYLADARRIRDGA